MGNYSSSTARVFKCRKCGAETKRWWQRNTAECACGGLMTVVDKREQKRQRQAMLDMRQR